MNTTAVMLAAHRQAKHRVMDLLGWTEEQYCMMQYNSGLYYLVLYLKEHKESIRMLEGSRLFWNWWKAKWYQRDMQFIAHAVSVPPQLYGPDSRVNDYYLYHDATQLAQSIAPGRVITYCLPKKEFLWKV